MNPKIGYLAALGMAAAGILLLVFGLRRPVTIYQEGAAPQTVETYALTAGWALHDAGVILAPGDEVSPAPDAQIGWQAAILIRRPQRVDLYLPGQAQPQTFSAFHPLPGALLAQAGARLFPGDRLLQNGQPVDPGAPLTGASQFVLQFVPAHSVTLVQDGQSSVVYTPGNTLASALWAGGLRPSPLDFFSANLAAPLTDSASIAYQAARPVSVSVDGKQITGRSSAATVGQALAELDISLQGMDRSLPAEDQPIPADGAIRVVRVREEIVLKETTLPFKSVTVADPTLDLDQTRLADPGAAGIKVTSQRVTYEDGKEVSRQTEAEWVASQPRDQKNAFGTRVSLKAIDTPDGTVQYYRAVRVYATSFAPCNFIQFIGHCSYNTANGMKLQKGVIGMGEAWYKLFANQRVYVDGYGFATVADWGYVPGFWIDLGYSDADFVNWHRYTTLYFLWPAPKNVPWVLPR